MKTILIIDDQKDDLTSMSQIITREGYIVITANDGTEALEKLGKNQVDLIIMDIMMPTISGYDLLRILNEKIHNKIPVIFVSIKPEKEVDITNVDGFVQKPFAPIHLIDQVGKAIEKYN